MLDNPHLEKAFRILRIIVCILGIGPLFLPAYLWFMGLDAPAGSQSDMTWITWGALAFAVVSILVWFVSPATTLNAAARGIAADTEPPRIIRRHPTWKRLHDADPETTRLAFGYYRATIIRCAFLNGAGFFSAVMYGVLTGDMLLLVVALLMSVMIFATFPTRSRVERAIETGRQAVRDAAS